MDQDGFFWITGRSKELIITAGGENIPPVPIEDNIKNELPEIISNAVIIGDKQKFLTCLISLKCNVDPNGIPLTTLTPEAKKWCSQIVSESPETIIDFENNDKLQNAIKEGIERANDKAIANPHKVQKFHILPIDFSMPGGELGPTLKLKRHFVHKKYSDAIENLYA